jgi:hypothetical protein
MKDCVFVSTANADVCICAEFSKAQYMVVVKDILARQVSMTCLIT